MAATPATSPRKSCSRIPACRSLGQSSAASWGSLDLKRLTTWRRRLRANSASAAFFKPYCSNRQQRHSPGLAQCARQKAVSADRDSRSPAARPRKLGPISGIEQRLRIQQIQCVSVAGGASLERTRLWPKFPASRENNREYRGIRADRRLSLRKTRRCNNGLEANSVTGAKGRAG